MLDSAGPRIVLNLEARTNALEKALEKVKAQNRAAFDAMKTDYAGFAANVNKPLRLPRIGNDFARDLQPANMELTRMARVAEEARGAVRGLVLAAAAGFGINEIRQASDGFLRVNNALKAAGIEGDALTTTYKALFDIAQRQGTPLEETAKLFGSITAAQKELGATSAESLKFTEGVGVALKVAGSSAQAASGALLQLGQLLGGGTVQAQEFNSIIDGARPILQAVASGLKEAGGSVSELKRIVSDGELSSQAFFRAFLAGLPEIEQKAASASDTSAQAFARIGNSLINLVGELDKATGASGAFAGGANAVAGGINRVAAAVPGAVEALKGYVAALRSALNMGDAFQAGIAARVQTTRDVQTTQLEARLRDPGLLPHQREGLQRQLSAVRAQSQLAAQAPQPDSAGRSEIDREATRAAGLGALPLPKPKPTITPISAADFPIPGKEKGGGRSGGGADRANEYERELQALNKRTAALNQEASTIGQSAGVIASAEAAFRLLNAAKEAGLTVSPALTAAIAKEAEAYAAAKTKVDELKLAQQQSQQFQQFIGQGVSGFFSDIISGGKNASDALMNLTKRLADAALQAALLGQGPLAGLFGNAAPQGGVGGIIGMLFQGASGLLPGVRAHTGGTVGISTEQIALAPRFHRGGAPGLGPKEHIAVLEYGERVLTKAQANRADATMAGMGAELARSASGGGRGGAPIINITTPPGHTAETSTGPNGSTHVIIKAISNGIVGQAARGQGPLKHLVGNASMRSG